ncbi:RagB/SusD family nutrient uptake outer membrane protein [Chitinophaga sp. G-6-1-13]|uniref:RagB/SusD family nutrient uptake outer membrane protein n=1 Tax=Chitinophaga fulva TaxID=2728842 RepID=A0A848GV20_9BACT|nr:RagB/SusD family nutrient uptake outer membrane protein [Chitinophaga fulva]NML39568.1 RagB/SusD family nutrient uptake outer membrane protein [Chitinophaga fulva]
MMMKRIGITMLFLAAGVFSGCNKLLEIEPHGKQTTATFFTTPATAKQGLIAAYKALQSNYRTNYPGYVRWVFGDVCSDDTRANGGDNPDMIQVEFFTANATNPFYENAWSTLYQGIHAANIVIEKAPGVKGMDEPTKKVYVAEGKFLRAYYYFNLVQIFGGVPLMLKEMLTDYNIPRNSKEEIYRQIEADLLDAEAVLPEKSAQEKSDYGRATKGAAQALLARVYMMQGKFTETETWTKKIIDSHQYSLDPVYYHNFTIDGEYGVEAIFEINFQYDARFYDEEGSGDGDGRTRGPLSYGWCYDNPTQDLVDAFEAGDPRKKATVYKTGDVLPDGTIGNTGTSATGYLCTKYLILKNEMPDQPKSSGKDQIVFRFGHILLWYAEAANENGHSQEALQALNQVRARAREGNAQILPDITATDKEKLRQAIWQEQRVEYATEVFRFYDLVRTKRAAKVLNDFAKKYNSQKGASFKAGVNEIFPIPQSQINLSQGVLVQNPGF